LLRAHGLYAEFYELQISGEPNGIDAEVLGETNA
jgi:hypothetical protein